MFSFLCPFLFHKLTSFRLCPRELIHFLPYPRKPHASSRVRGPPVSTQVYTRPVASAQVTAFPTTFPYVGVSQATSTQVSLVSSSSLQVPRLPEASSRVSSFPVCPPMSSAPANAADLSGTRVAHSHNSVVPPYLLATGLSAAAQSYNHTGVRRVADSFTAPFTYSTACQRTPSCYDRLYHGENEC